MGMALTGALLVSASVAKANATLEAISGSQTKFGSSLGTDTLGLSDSNSQMDGGQSYDVCVYDDWQSASCRYRVI